MEGKARRVRVSYSRCIMVTLLPSMTKAPQLLTLTCRALKSNHSGCRQLVGERSRVENGDVSVTIQIVALLATEVGVVNDGDDNLRRNEV